MVSTSEAHSNTARRCHRTPTALRQRLLGAGAEAGWMGSWLRPPLASETARARSLVRRVRVERMDERARRSDGDGARTTSRMQKRRMGFLGGQYLQKTTCTEKSLTTKIRNRNIPQAVGNALGLARFIVLLRSNPTARPLFHRAQSTVTKEAVKSRGWSARGARPVTAAFPFPSCPLAKSHTRAWCKISTR
jgi:hypothetical protein